LQNARELTLTYNKHQTPFFGHTQIQAQYLAHWLSARLNWNIPIQIQSADWEYVGPGNLISLQFSADHLHVDCKRLPEHPSQIRVEISHAASCDLPYQFVLGKSSTGQSLAKEITRQGTSAHYSQVLQRIHAKNVG
jgi:hypothetical protein